MSTKSAATETKTSSDVHTKTDVAEPQPKSHDLLKEEYLDISNNEQLEYEETVEDPLYVVDRTKNFWLNQPIQYNSSNNEKTSSPRPDVRVRQPNPCWNCGNTDHALITCPIPRNQRTIAQNRQIFLAQKQQQQSTGRPRYVPQKTQRYFRQEKKSLDAKYIPGKISKHLLKALDVPSNGLPLHIYKMREHGYPNGWLKEAREKYSGISIFTGPNECLPLPGREEGNYVFSCNINKNKLHKFPGFNAPCPPNTVDEFERYGCPQYNPKQSLDSMHEELTYTKYKKISKKSPKHNSSIEDFDNAKKYIDKLRGNEDLNLKIFKDDNLEMKPPSSPEEGEITDDDDDDDGDEDDTDEIICLSANKMEFPYNTSSETVPENPGVEQSQSDTDQSFKHQLDLSINVDAQSSLSSSLNADSGSVSTSSSLKRKFGDIKSEVLGTPILKRFSTYENRPTSANFAKGMVDMIDHENLPNAVGTFKKIKDILNDVRKTLNNLL